MRVSCVVKLPLLCAARCNLNSGLRSSFSLSSYFNNAASRNTRSAVMPAANTSMVANAKAPEFKCHVVRASTAAAQYMDQVRGEVTKLTEKGLEPPCLVAFIANAKDPGARSYARATEKACASVGVKYELRETTPEKLSLEIGKANEDAKVSGIMVYYPVWGERDPLHDKECRELVSPDKDVEGLCKQHRDNMYNNVRFLDAPSNKKKCILPCTALAIMKLLEHLNFVDTSKPTGARVSSENNVACIVNRSEVVGRPLAVMLANDGAKVFSVDVNSTVVFEADNTLGQSAPHAPTEEEVKGKEAELENIFAKANVIVTGVPSKEYKINAGAVKAGTKVINFSSFKNVDGELLDPSCTFVPDIGAMSVAMLLRNLLRLYNNEHS